MQCQILGRVHASSPNEEGATIYPVHHRQIASGIPEISDTLLENYELIYLVKHIFCLRK